MKIINLSTLLLLVVALVACNSVAGPTPSLPQGQIGPVYISSSELLIMESYPVQVSLHVTGDLPTPCHRFQADVAKPDGQNRIQVTAYSLSNPDLMCAQVLSPFDETVPIPMSGQPDGTYSVYLNGDLVGQFEYSD